MSTTPRTQQVPILITGGRLIDPAANLGSMYIETPRGPSHEGSTSIDRPGELMNRSSLLLAAVLAVSPLLHAQSEPTPAQMAQTTVTRYTQSLGLTSTQQEQALTLFTTEQTTDDAIRTSQKLARQLLNTAIAANDTASITQVSTMLGELDGQTTLARSVAEGALYLILTTEQQAKFVQILSAGPAGISNGPPRR